MTEASSSLGKKSSLGEYKIRFLNTQYIHILQIRMECITLKCLGKIILNIRINHRVHCVAKNHRKMKNPQGKNFKTVIFNHEDKAYKYTFKVIAPDFWESFDTDNVKFDIHYCEDDNDIIVYEVIDGYSFEFPIVYKRQIK